MRRAQRRRGFRQVEIHQATLARAVQQTFSVIVEKDEDGWFVGSVPELPGCHTQARTREELRERVKEAILLYLETKGRPAGIEFVGVDTVEVTG